MKRCLSNSIRCLLAVSLLLFGTIPCQAAPFPPAKQLVSMEELLQWYGGLSGNVLQEGAATNPIVSSGEVILGVTSCRVDIVLLGGLRVPAGARLTIDNPNLVLMGESPTITVEPGGVLHIQHWHALTTQAMPQAAIVVQAGGTLLLEPGITLPDGMVIDQNLPPDNLLPPAITPPTTPDETTPPTTPDETTPPEIPPVEETLSIKGEVLKVSAGGGLLTMLTLPLVDPACTETVVIERSADAEVWNKEYTFRWSENTLGFLSDEVTEFGNLFGRDRSDGRKTDFRYLAKLSGAPFYLRVIQTGVDGQQRVSNAIQLTEPPVGQYPGSDDYEDSEGNRGGGGQGTTDREEQKETAVSRPDSAVTAEPQAKTKPSATAGAAASSAPQTDAPTAPSTAEPQTATLPAQANLPEQSGQAAEEPSEPLSSAVRNALVIVATVVLCGAIWVFTTKRKKS